jgi:hypothetical protein
VATSSCFDPDCDPEQPEKCYTVNLECEGCHPGKDGMPGTGDDLCTTDDPPPPFSAWTGGDHPVGVTTYTCSATSKICGDKTTDTWTVTVNEMNTIDVTLQIEPVIVPDNLVRCIKFEIFTDTIQDPYIFSRDILLVVCMITLVTTPSRSRRKRESTGISGV